MKILLLGKTGQLGWELQRSLAPLGELIALGRGVEGESRWCGDLAQPQALAQTVRALKPNVIVNAAAYTAVDKAESERETARQINALSLGVLAQEAQALGAWLVHYSSDYVFDGSGQQPWREGDAPAPLSVYGQTKLEGERLIQAHCQRHLILRTSWVYAARGGNFAKTMLRLAQEREQLSVVSDQIGAPTGADLLADVTALALHRVASADRTNTALTGLYHLTASGQTSWHGYAQYVLGIAQRLGVTLKTPPEQVKAIPSASYPTPAQRPLNSRLDCSKLQTTFGLCLPPWQLGVERMLAEVLA